MLIHGNRAEALRDVLVAWIQTYPLAPLEDEVVLVQSNGIAQWLRLAMADACGIAAALRFDLPSRFLWRAYRAVLGEAAVPEASPLDESRLLWRLMRLLPELLDEPAFAPLARFLDGDVDARKRFQLAQRLADLFDQYQVYRADWLAAWAAGEDVLTDPCGRDALPLPEDQRWQAALWRALRADLAAAGLSAGGGRAAVHEAFMTRARELGDERPAGLPRRVLVFGLSSLPQQSLEVLAVLARWSQVMMCVHNPCEYHWADIVPGRELLRQTRTRRQSLKDGFPSGLDEDALHQHAHPLLAAWGRQGRDFIALLDDFDNAELRTQHMHWLAGMGQRIDCFDPTGGASLLAQLQDDIRELRPLAETRQRWPAVAARDASVQFHVAHGALREVEILHDRLLAAFDADSTLRPRDVIVMVPDIDAYAPHVRAVFGLHAVDDPRRIPYCLADQGARAIDPVLRGVELLLGVPDGRMKVGDLLDLLEVPALRRRFGLQEADLPTLARWIRGANVRWGLHAGQARRLGLPVEDEVPAHSWLFGLRRMLLGYAAGPEVAWQEIESYGEVGGLDAALIGPLAQLLARLDGLWSTLAEAATPPCWAQRLSAMLTDFFDADEDAEATLTLARLETALADWQEICAEAALDEPLPRAVVAEHWLSALDGGGLTQRFFAGAVTFATLMPMRAIPFRHVCLLGMNDGDYPRTRTPLDIDLMSLPGRYRPGDRSRREDDRYLFLEALLSARDVLYISWVGRSISDNAERPASVLVGQLRDHLQAGWGWREGDRLLAQLSVEHRLQPFSPAYFGADAALYTYAREWRETAEAPQRVGARLDAPGREEPLTLEELSRFLRAPARGFFRTRLGADLSLEETERDDVEPFDADGLQRWQRGDELITLQRRALEAGADVAAAREAGLARLARRGDLAPGGFGAAEARELAEPMQALFEQYAAELAQWPLPLEDEPLALEIDGEAGPLALADRLGELRANAHGERVRLCLVASRLVNPSAKGAYRHEVLWRHWPQHLAAQLGGPTRTRLLSTIGDASFAPLEAGVAREHLADLLRVYEQGLRAPLPFAVRTAAELLARKDARKIYEGDDYRSVGERDRDPHLARVWPDYAALEAAGLADWAGRLLQPMLDALHAPRDAAKEES